MTCIPGGSLALAAEVPTRNSSVPALGSLLLETLFCEATPYEESCPGPCQLRCYLLCGTPVFRGSRSASLCPSERSGPMANARHADAHQPSPRRADAQRQDLSGLWIGESAV